MAIDNTLMKTQDSVIRTTGAAVRDDHVRQPFFCHPVTGNADLTDPNGFNSGNLCPGSLVPIFKDGRVEYQVWNEADDAFQHGVQMHGMEERLYLKWVAGKNGLVSINATLDFNSTFADTEFETALTLDKEFELLGGGASAGDCTYHAEGGLKFETDGTNGNEQIIVPHLDTSVGQWSQVTWGSDREVWWECCLVSGSDITDNIIWAGLKLTNTEVKATDDDQVYFRYEDSVASGNMEVVSSIGGTDISTDTGVTVAADTVYHMAIRIDSDRLARCYLNGVLVFTTAALTDTKDFIPYIGVAEDGSGSARHFIVRGQAISRLYG